MLSQVTFVGGLTFNDNNSYIVTAVPGLSGAMHRRASYDLAGADGGVLDAAYYGRRRFSIQGMIIGHTDDEYVQLRDAFSTALTHYKESGQIAFLRSDGVGMTIQAGLIGQPDLDPDPDTPTGCRFNLPFEAVHPYLQADYTVETVLSPAQLGGAEIAATIPMSLSANVGGNAVISNNGTAPAFPVVVIAGPVVNPVIRNLTTNQDATMAITLADGESLTVDFQRHTILDQTGRSRRDVFSGSWWALPLGVSEVAFAITSTTGDPTVTVRFTPNYMSL